MIIIFGYKSHEILVPQTGIKPVPREVEAQNLNHWTTRELPHLQFVLVLGIE